MNRTDAAKMMARWAEQGWLRRVRRGLYLAVPVHAEQPNLWSEDPLVLGAVAWDPCYFTGWTAAQYWSLTEQVFRTTVVKTTHRVREPRERLLEHEYLLGRVSPERLDWGIRHVWIRDKRVGMADEARVIIDVLDDPSIGGGIRHCSDMVTTYLAEHEQDTLVEYGERFGNGAVFKRLGYLCDHLGLADEAFLVVCEERLTSGFAVLDPQGPEGGTRNARWRLHANVQIEAPAES